MLPKISVFLSVGLFLASANASGQNLSRRIDYTTKAVTIKRALSELSDRAGVTLFAEPQFEREILILRLKDISIRDAMMRIADTVGAEWVKEGNKYELERSAKLENKLRQASVEALGQDFKESLDRQRNLLKFDKPLGQEEVDRLAAQYVESQRANRPPGAVAFEQNLLPDQRAMWRTLCLIDPKEVAEIEGGERVVFSNKPTAMEREISGDFSGIGSSMQDDHNRFSAAYEKAQKPGALYIPINPGFMQSPPEIGRAHV